MASRIQNIENHLLISSSSVLSSCVNQKPQKCQRDKLNGYGLCKCLISPQLKAKDLWDRKTNVL